MKFTRKDIIKLTSEIIQTDFDENGMNMPDTQTQPKPRKKFLGLI